MKQYCLILDEKEKEELERILKFSIKYNNWTEKLDTLLYLRVKDLKTADRSVFDDEYNDEKKD
jgi:hypothetical protein